MTCLQFNRGRLRTLCFGVSVSVVQWKRHVKLCRTARWNLDKHLTPSPPVLGSSVAATLNVLRERRVIY